MTRAELRKLISTTLMKKNYFVCAQGHFVFVCFPDSKDPITAATVTAELSKNVLQYVRLTDTPRNIVQIDIIL